MANKWDNITIEMLAVLLSLISYEYKGDEMVEKISQFPSIYIYVCDVVIMGSFL